jgi:hypothetical protein
MNGFVVSVFCEYRRKPLKTQKGKVKENATKESCHFRVNYTCYLNEQNVEITPYVLQNINPYHNHEIKEE